jgi:hypothetical protein
VEGSSTSSIVDVVVAAGIVIETAHYNDLAVMGRRAGVVVVGAARTKGSDNRPTTCDAQEEHSDAPHDASLRRGRLVQEPDDARFTHPILDCTGNTTIQYYSSY